MPKAKPSPPTNSSKTELAREHFQPHEVSSSGGLAAGEA